MWIFVVLEFWFSTREEQSFRTGCISSVGIKFNAPVNRSEKKKIYWKLTCITISLKCAVSY